MIGDDEISSISNLCYSLVKKSEYFHSFDSPLFVNCKNVLISHFFLNNFISTRCILLRVCKHLS